MDDTLIRYARRLSHDLNNFSTVVRTYSELLLSELPADSSTYADVSEIQRAAESMVQYLQRVTRFARTSGMRRSPVAVDAGITDAAEAFRRQVPGRPVEVAVATSAYIGADVVWWREILAELLQNAHEAAPAGAPIIVRAVATPTHAVIEVRDSGPGFPAALSNLGEPFVTAKTGVRGAGMGLALVTAFVAAQDGTVSFGRDGHETVVRLELPTMEPPAP
jgi:signal transduction histidine kinase